MLAKCLAWLAHSNGPPAGVSFRAGGAVVQEELGGGDGGRGAHAPCAPGVGQGEALGEE